MQTIGINEFNDIFIDNSNNLCIKKDLDAMGDIFVNKSQTVLGECLYDSDKGINFFNTIFDSPCYPDLFQNELITQLEDTEAVYEIKTFKDEITNNVYKYSVEIQTDFGKVALNG